MTTCLPLSPPTMPTNQPHMQLISRLWLALCWVVLCDMWDYPMLFSCLHIPDLCSKPVSNGHRPALYKCFLPVPAQSMRLCVGVWLPFLPALNFVPRQPAPVYKHGCVPLDRCVCLRPFTAVSPMKLCNNSTCCLFVTNNKAEILSSSCTALGSLYGPLHKTAEVPRNGQRKWGCRVVVWPWLCAVRWGWAIHTEVGSLTVWGCRGFLRLARCSLGDCFQEPLESGYVPVGTRTHMLIIWELLLLPSTLVEHIIIY